MIDITGSRSDKTTKALIKMKRDKLLFNLNQIGEKGVELLSQATPIDSHLTASSWAYRIVEERNGPRVEWYNTNPDENGQTPVAVLLQYGHATQGGGYVQAQDFINPAIQPMFDEIMAEIWRRVTA